MWKLFGIKNKIIEEKVPVTRQDISSVCEQLSYNLEDFIARYSGKSEKIVEHRYKRFRKY